MVDSLAGVDLKSMVLLEGVLLDTGVTEILRFAGGGGFGGA